MSRRHAEVIGDPIGHSKSPVIHRFWLEALGIDAGYAATRVAAEGLGRFLAERAEDPSWAGCNVTLPHKIAVLDHVADDGGLRQSIGAINTVFRDADGSLTGTNTDAGGFLAPLCDLELAAASVCVVGAGGAARAILFALAERSVGHVTILNRDIAKAAALLEAYALHGEALPLSAPVPPARLLVNASALGMAGQPPLALDLAPMPNDAVVYDIVYAPLETPLLRQARGRGLETVDGLEMLVGQAAIAFEILFGQAPPRDRDAELRTLLLR